MMTFGQKLVAYTTLVLLNVMFLLFMGILAIVPILFSILLVFQLRKL